MSDGNEATEAFTLNHERTAHIIAGAHDEMATPLLPHTPRQHSRVIPSETVRQDHVDMAAAQMRDRTGGILTEEERNLLANGAISPGDVLTAAGASKNQLVAAALTQTQMLPEVRVSREPRSDDVQGHRRGARKHRQMMPPQR